MPDLPAAGRQAGMTIFRYLIAGVIIISRRYYNVQFRNKDVEKFKFPKRALIFTLKFYARNKENESEVTAQHRQTAAY